MSTLPARATDGCPLGRDPIPHRPAPAEAQPLPTEVRADRAQSEPEGVSEFIGNVEATRGAQRISADRLRYQRDTDEAHATGNVTFTDSSGAQFHTPEIKLKLGTREGYAEG